MNNNEVNIYLSGSSALVQIIIGIILLLLGIIAGVMGSGGGFILLLLPSSILIFSGCYSTATLKKPAITISNEGISSRRWGFIRWSAIDKISISTEKYTNGATIEHLNIGCKNGIFHSVCLNGLATDKWLIKNCLEKYSGRHFY